MLAAAMREVEPSSELPIEAWIDRRGLPLRIRVDWREAVDAYDVPVDVERPPGS